MMTKRIKMLLCMMVTASVLMACGGSDDNGGGGGGAVTVNVSKSTVTLPATGGTLTVDVTCTGREWTAYSDSDWLKVSVTGSTSQTGSITLKAAANTGNERTALVTVKSGTTRVTVTVTQGAHLQVSRQEVWSSSKGETLTVEVTSSEEWTATADASWIATEKSGSTLAITTAANDTKASRKGTVTVKAGEESVAVTVMQESAEDSDIEAPEGYRLVWHDEFDKGTTLGSDWTHEVKNDHWVNNELQNYRDGSADGKRVTEIVDGKLNINCFKGSDGKIYSGRVYAKVREGWKYGYIEARIKLPKGRGTWPAFWMMPVNFRSWPDDGEIDIMEEVGANPNYVSSSLHAKAHVHTSGTQVTHEMYCEGAEDDFHVYAIKWTHENITTYVDGKVQLKYDNQGLGRDDWPYDDAFYVILNLAWGGDWGGYKGVDEGALPTTMKIDYVRVFQEK